MPQREDSVAKDTAPSAEEVLAFLKRNPDFLVENAAALDLVAPPARSLGDGVVDLQHAMIGRLRDKVAESEGVARFLINTSRDNLSTTARIHESVLALLDATSFEQLIQIATVDLGVLLDVDAVTLCIEADGAASLPIKGLRMVPAGAVDHHIGARQQAALTGDISADPAIFGGAAPLIRSEALVRLYISPSTPPAMLAFGSRDAERFQTGQATELLQFLARVLEKLICVWLDLPPDDEDEELDEHG